MFFNRTKWLTLMVVLCLAVLLALQPFIHAHLDVEHPIQHSGFHVGSDYEESLSVHHDQPSHSVSAIPHVSHIVKVAPSIKQGIDLALVVDVAGLILVSFCLAIAIKLTAQQFSQLNPSFYQPLKRRLPAARAPPQY